MKSTITRCTTRSCLLAVAICTFQFGCVTKQIETRYVAQEKPDRTTVEYHRQLAEKTDEPSYEEMGRLWGERIKTWKQSNPEEDVNKDFILFLLTKDPRGLTSPGVAKTTEFFVENFAEQIYKMISKDPGARPSYYFQIHTSLKRAFQRGFQTGFVHRNADMVLGPHITYAARVLATVNAYRFKFNVRDYAIAQDSLARSIVAAIEDAKIASTTKSQLDATVENSVEIFKELIAEGSPADRRQFQEHFQTVYGKESQGYMANPPESIAQFIVDATATSLGHAFTNAHTEVHTDSRSRKEVFSLHDMDRYAADLTLVGAEDMWGYIYRRSVTEVGYEMGTKSSHNLINRDDLVDWLRRALIALDDYEAQKDWILEGFQEAYREADNERMGKDVFLNLLRDTGLDSQGRQGGPAE